MLRTGVQDGRDVAALMHRMALALLREHGCDELQGFLLGRPAPPPVQEALVAASVA